MAVTITNDSEISFGTPTAAGPSITWLVVTINSDSANIQLSNTPGAIAANREITIAAGALDIIFTNTGFPDDIHAEIMNEALDEVAVTVSARSADPGDDHSGGVITTDGYADATVAAGGFSASVT